LTTPDVLREIIGHADSEPGHPAVRDENRELSYAQLIDEVARVGAALARRGVGDGDRVALLLDNSVDFVVTALAILWVGAAFVPLAVRDPVARLVNIVSDCEPALVVTASDPGDVASFGDVATVTISDLRSEESNPTTSLDPSSRVAYMIYTSGTTGTPKGVQIGSAAFGAAVRAAASAVGLDRDTRALCVSPLYFDGAYANVFATLFAGGTAVLWPRDALLFPRTFFQVVARESITYTSFSPSYLRLLLASPKVEALADSTLRVVALGGEACSVEDIRALWSHAPGVRVFNRYGPTETTIAVSHVQLTPAMLERGAVPIGRPHAGVSFHLVDRDGTMIEETDRVGELYIGGAQLMNGYWNAPTLTDEVLRSDVVPGEVVYRTGDLVYRDERGDYVYVDRADRVVKRSGIRISLIELGETVRALANVAAAACTTFDNEGELGIVAFVVTKRPLSALDLRLAALERLPETMLPDRIEIVEELPLNKSNKLDEGRLLGEAGLRPHRPASAPGATTPSV